MLNNDDLIQDLHGNTYKKGGYRLYLAFPSFHGVTEYSYNKDVLHNKSFNIFKTVENIYAITWNSSIKCYVCYTLRFIVYNELQDIRKSHLHGNRYHS